MNLERKPPRVFLSYSYDSKPHKDWVRDFLASSLEESGIHVILDQWDLAPGKDLTMFMEELSNVDYVLLVCTPQYAAKANERTGGVGYETSVITGEIAADAKGVAEKFIPILRDGDWETARPSYIKSKVAVKMTGEVRTTDESYKDLVLRIFGHSSYPRPQRGQVPSYVLERSRIDTGLKQASSSEPKQESPYVQSSMLADHEVIRSIGAFDDLIKDIVPGKTGLIRLPVGDHENVAESIEYNGLKAEAYWTNGRGNNPITDFVDDGRFWIFDHYEATPETIWVYKDRVSEDHHFIAIKFSPADNFPVHTGAPSNYQEAALLEEEYYTREEYDDGRARRSGRGLIDLRGAEIRCRKTTEWYCLFVCKYSPYQRMENDNLIAEFIKELERKGDLTEDMVVPLRALKKHPVSIKYA